MRRRRAAGEGGGKKQKRGKKWVVQGEWEWDSTQEFIIERLIGKMVADGQSEVPGRGVMKAGTVLYKVLWEGWPEELATWEEEEEDIPCGEVDFVAQSMTPRRRPRRPEARRREGRIASRRTRCE